MIIATLGVGDDVVTLYESTALMADEKGSFAKTYNLSVVDSATDKQFTQVFNGEREALIAFAAIIVADMWPPFKEIEDALAFLRDSPMNRFLPC
jgi:hypothetical protein